MSQNAIVAGVGMIPFAKPGASDSYDVMGERATRLALEDAGIDFCAIEQAYAGYVYGDSTAGQKALYRVGMSGIPVINVNNNCSTGSTALFLARQAIASGAAHCVLALGFEQMKPGALGTVFADRPSPFEAFDQATDALVGHPEIPLALRYFGGAGMEHMRRYGTKLETFASIRAKASRHAANNPNHQGAIQVPRTIAAAGLNDRVSIASGDFFVDPFPSADVLTMGMILHDWNLDHKMRLLRSAYDALPVGGVLIVIENLIDDARRENAFGLMMSLNMLIEFGDAFDFTGEDLSGWCREVGFKKVDFLPLAGPATAGIAYK